MVHASSIWALLQLQKQLYSLPSIIFMNNSLLLKKLTCSSIVYSIYPSRRIVNPHPPNVWLITCPVVAWKSSHSASRSVAWRRSTKASVRSAPSSARDARRADSEVASWATLTNQRKRLKSWKSGRSVGFLKKTIVKRCLGLPVCVYERLYPWLHSDTDLPAMQRQRTLTRRSWRAVCKERRSASCSWPWKTWRLKVT